MPKRKASAKFLAAGNAWRSHLNEFRKNNPNMSLKQQMKAASRTYKKGSSAKSSSSASSKGVMVKTSKYEVRVRRKSKRKSKKRSKKGSKKRSKKRSRTKRR